MKNFYLPTKLRPELKKVWGKPIFGEKNEVAARYQKIIKEKEFKKIITVGDYCSFTLFSDVKIFDGKVKRKRFKGVLPFSLSCPNPSGTIQADVWPIIKKAINSNENIFVEGEEDLLVIPAVLLSENNTAVVYGFPGKGICLINVSVEIKESFKKLLDKFKTE
ncbi:MAG: DUF359 domain-containing protein [Patescibacteria group bacterium]|nr:DUF359 domain-containing protein [Patescibacteria group bacterium]